jgi:DNA-binding beta-propeller fold protein YncE
MLKIGDRQLSQKDIFVGVILILVAIAAVWTMIGAKPKPVVMRAANVPGGLVLQEGGQPGAGYGQFNYPRGIAVDGDGNIYVADSRNHRIQKISGTDGKFLNQFGGLFDATKLANGDPKKLITQGPGKLNEPNGVSFGGPDGLIYIVDTWNNRIQEFTTGGKSKKIFTSDDGFFAPRELVVDPAGDVYVADTGHHRIVKFDPSGKQIRSWGAINPKTGASVAGKKLGEFNEPIGLALDKAGNLYIADRLNFRIQVLSPDGQVLRSWPVKGWSKEQIDMEPHLALDQTHNLIYATDGRGKKVYCYHLDGSEVSTIEKDSTGNQLFIVPLGVSVDGSGNLYVVDAGAGKVFKIKGQF